MSRKFSRSLFSIPACDLLQHVPAWECHIHTNFADGEASVADCARKAKQKGLTRIIFTEHTEPCKTKSPGWFDDYSAQVKQTAQEYSGIMEVFLGVEAPATDYSGGVEITESMIQQSDYILGAAHRYPGLEGRRVRDLSPSQCIELERMTLLSLTKSPIVEAIAHVGGTCQKYCCPFPVELIAEVVRTATKFGIAIEINSRHHTNIRTLMEICIKENAWVTIGSDAHTLDEISGAYSTLNAFSLKDV